MSICVWNDRLWNTPGEKLLSHAGRIRRSKRRRTMGEKDEKKMNKNENNTTTTTTTKQDIKSAIFRLC